ncbi:lipopolysaccharide biosynthesis protein [Marinobacter xestospongiae]|uniref:Lipopolysaccharide biosynthesis protein n=1 Tax=Marinobacter xestospongiae TaxID=994319 RepID=A0ABU3VZN1_9GAMM|nr:lipopolysaccharide biosynthesis protein [Marinobacter xestospongiae]MDV2079744.1 lipopolysaccharide biosynthesis protein [Marinobacter xestospongiae]
MSAGFRVIRSAALLLGLQVIQRGLGIISTLILARLLTPEHFGIVALVTIALQFFELLVETGNQQYIVQKKHLSDDDLHTAWSLDVVIKSSVAVLIIASSPALARYFDTPELTLALSVAALTLPIRALKTPGMMKLAREINYRPLFRLTLWQKSLSFITVIGLALVRPDHWAIIAGNVVSAVILAVGSYRVHSFRPRWTLVHAREQWQFSQWLLMRGLVGFTRSQIDNLLVSRFFGTEKLGGYNLVREISLLPALSAIIPMSEPLLAAIAERKDQAEVLAYRVRLSLAIMITLLTPITAIIMLFPEAIVALLLGSDWAAYGPLLRPFGLFFFTFCLFALTSDAVIAQGRVKPLFWFDVISTLTIIAALLLYGNSNLNTMAWLRGWLAVLTTAALMLLLNRWCQFGLQRLAFLCLPTATALLAALAAFLALAGRSSLSAAGEPIGVIELLWMGPLVLVSYGAVFIVACLLILRHTEEFRQVQELLGSLLTRNRHPGDAR